MLRLRVVTSMSTLLDTLNIEPASEMNRSPGSSFTSAHPNAPLCAASTCI